MILQLTYIDEFFFSFTYDEHDSKQKTINLRSCPATNFFLARERYSYAVMAMQPHIQAAKCHQYEIYTASRFFVKKKIEIMQKNYTAVNYRICSLSLSLVLNSLVFLI